MLSSGKSPRPRHPFTARKIRGMREQMCLTQEQFAELLGVTQGRVSQWEKNMGHPNGSAVRLLKQVLARIERSEKV